jgi:hypothetical protein
MVYCADIHTIHAAITLAKQLHPAPTAATYTYTGLRLEFEPPSPRHVHGMVRRSANDIRGSPFYAPTKAYRIDPQHRARSTKRVRLLK